MSTDTIDQPRTAAEPVQLDHPTETAYRLPLHLVRPSAYNPRKRFDPAGLEELADSIARNGVQQAIVVRRVPPIKAGGAEFEIVAGERRWRACGLLAKRGTFAAPHSVPAFVRDLDDFEAREIALTENSHRNDLHPLEEAQAYEDLLLKPVGGGEFKPARLKGYTVEQLAERIGHKPNFVFGRLKLLQLIPEGQEAFFAGTLTLKIAEAVARLPVAEQKRAVPAMVAGWGGEPWTHRGAMEHLQRHYMLALAKTVFKIDDATLIPKAGACTACPKRSSVNPDLFNAAGANDMCLDGVCFNAKTKAFGERKIEQARDAGRQVFTGAAAKKLLGGRTETSDYTLKNNGQVNLDKAAPELTGSKKTLRSLLGKDFDSELLVQAEYDDQPTSIAKVTDVKAALKAKGLLNPQTTTPLGGKAQRLTPEVLKGQRDDRIQDKLDERLPAALWKLLQSDGAAGFPGDSKAWMYHLADWLYTYGEFNVDAIEAAVNGGKKVGGREWIEKLNTEGLARLTILLVMSNAITDEQWKRKNDAAHADALAADINFDLPALRAEIAEEVDAQIRDEIAELADVVKPTAGKAPAKKAAKATKPAAAPKAPAETKAAALTPIQALENAFEKRPAAEAPAKPVKVTTKKASKSVVMPTAAAPKNTLSPEAAWPFPTRPRP